MAIAEAYKSTHESFKHGAILAYGKTIISTGYNQPSRNNYDFKSTHAEMQTIINAKRQKRNIKNADIYVIRISKTGEIRQSKPCNICMRILKNNDIKTIYYSNYENTIDVMHLK